MKQITNKTTYLYQYQNFIGKFDTLLKAAEKANETPMIAYNVIGGKTKQTRKGYFYSNHQLSEEEIQKLKKEKEPTEQKNIENKYKKYRELNGYQFIITSNNTNLFEFPRSRKDKVKLLKLYIYKNMMDAWQKKPKNIVTLEKEFVKEICTALET